MEKIMFSFIIPTMYRSNKINDLLKILEFEPLVKEVIIIENAPQNSGYLEELIDYSFYKKVKLLTQNENIFVNPAWNLGAQHASGEYLAICNDDINFKPIILKDILHYYSTYDEIGFIGMHNSQYENDKKPILFGIKQTESLNSGWGSLIFTKKENYIPIPDDLKIYFGDNYFVDYSKYPCYAYFGHKLDGTISATCVTIQDINKFIEEEGMIYRNKYKLSHPLWVK